MNIGLIEKQDEFKKIANKKEFVKYILKSGKDIEKISDEDRGKMDAQIMAKLKAGKKLSQREMNYLRKNNPILYAHALRIQRMAEKIEEELKHARSKEEANHIISASLSGISKNDPDREFIYAAVNRVSTEFHKSGAYEKLPNTIDEANKKNSKESGDVFSDGENEEDSDKNEFDLKNWSPLTEVYDAFPKFVADA